MDLSDENYFGADVFFENYSVGNTPNKIDNPYERFESYRMFLKQLYCHNKVQYRKIHKGNPFFFLAWCAFDFCDYEKAFTYLDAAISEDIRKDPVDWLGNPAAQFLFLNSKGQVADQTINKLRDRLNGELVNFKDRTGLELKLDNFVKQFPDKPFILIIPRLALLFLHFMPLF